MPRSDNTKTLKKLNERVKYLEGVICALLTEVSSRLRDVDAFIEHAEENGSVDIKSLWIQHQLEDKQRMRDLISKLSSHEKSLLKELLK